MSQQFFCASELATFICILDHLPPSRTASPVSQFEVDDIQVRYHPNSGCPTQVYHFEDYRCGPGAPAAPPKVDPEPWRPFRTRIDFETGSSDLFIAVDFTKEEVVVPFQGVDQTFPLFHHSLWDWAVDLLQDPEVGPHFVFDAQQLSRFDGEKFVRYIHEPWTADAFWEYQSGMEGTDVRVQGLVPMHGKSEEWRDGGTGERGNKGMGERGNRGTEDRGNGGSEDGQPRESIL
ncbi:uncharacterized protein EDB91DRAFT_1252672 [Suillus paluster]|uniref:uncharacterized protein n=1 Tax=Suillus paluster TaxID=48578 RepID=UPI001B867223|nr:uncharacterized protein EDB91DRAFT_1252672 [Suillus paluster]KAG1730408.1 hypothetical protein EDB91DRAFT_1252672 [Suillus paluster]